MVLLGHGQKVNMALELEGNAQGTVSLSTTGAQSAALAEGIYHVWTTADCYIKVAATASDVTTSTGYLLKSTEKQSIYVNKDSKLGGIVAASTATLTYHLVG